MEFSVDSYKLMRDTGDELLLDFLEGDEKENLQKHKQEVFDLIDPYRLKTPGDLIVAYYNYCIVFFKKEKDETI